LGLVLSVTQVSYDFLAKFYLTYFPPFTMPKSYSFRIKLIQY